ncbi:homogentisate 1,2-dioxygenase [Fluviispira sanaruensis]|uniref:Homogentisate 1,2-dioxygenase n=1 Tax=Fluviispira sanaruensis TaxID=2493639 RepID=A0A4V0P2S0_FLUSA|nr:homogentisate 1,2-dioxygenase [Fluviispira sanaruensis]BBH54197.1 homogentisate 1,2-dioxygenase [Fluviispira sanaruensis]
MIDYRKLGYISEKQHTFCEFEGKMVAEHVITRNGFNDNYSILYQKRAPTHEVNAEIYKSENPFFPSYNKLSNNELKRRHFKTPNYSKEGNLLEARATLLVNNTCSVGILNQTKNDHFFFANADADELYFVTEGNGILQTVMGEIDYASGDYLFIPKAIPYRFLPSAKSNMFIVEGKNNFGIPKEFRLAQGQFKLDAPYNHRDFHAPSRLMELKCNENYPIIIKKDNVLTKHEYTDFPYKVVGWDGWYWPFSFSIHSYQPKTSSVHLPPTVHTAFSGDNFYIMNFVPRVLDYHPKAIPCPWPHSNIDCDEAIFYISGDFTSRKGISNYSISFHPSGIPHGPHPERYEQSIGAKRTEELAIMVDTFEPLFVTEAAAMLEDKKYHYTWDSHEHL